jgi:hypothetical protein
MNACNALWEKSWD